MPNLTVIHPEATDLPYYLNLEARVRPMIGILEWHRPFPRGDSLRNGRAEVTVFRNLMQKKSIVGMTTGGSWG